MNPPWLLIDVPNIAFRAFATTGGLSHNGDPTGTVYGFFKQLAGLQRRFQTTRVAFAFDRTHDHEPVRRKLFPGYKAKRNTSNKTPQQAEAFAGYYQQLNLLRTEYLPELGYRNVFSQPGYEADDVIAALCNDCGGPPVVIVSSDHDLWQCLSDWTKVWSPSGKLVSLDDFIDEWGIEPYQWAQALALAGCPGDGVVGLKGVGEKTACRYLAGTLPKHSSLYRKIKDEGPEMLKRNLPLISLPFLGTSTPELAEDEFSPAKWRALCKRLGFQSILGEF